MARRFSRVALSVLLSAATGAALAVPPQSVALTYDRSKNSTSEFHSDCLDSGMLEWIMELMSDCHARRIAGDINLHFGRFERTLAQSFTGFDGTIYEQTKRLRQEIL